jgi:hypothetical protein
MDAAALAEAGDELDGSVATEMAVARVSVPAAAIVIARERLADMNEGRGIYRAKKGPLNSSRCARSTSTPDATIRVGERGWHRHADLTQDQGAEAARGSHALAGEVLLVKGGTQQSLAAGISQHSPREAQRPESGKTRETPLS